MSTRGWVTRRREVTMLAAKFAKTDWVEMNRLGACARGYAAHNMSQPTISDWEHGLLRELSEGNRRFDLRVLRKEDCLYPLHTYIVPTGYDQSSPGASDPARYNSIRFYLAQYDAPTQSRSLSATVVG